MVVLSLAASESGHLLVYQARFGARAAAAQSSGAHAYFPSLAAGLAGAAGLALIIALVLIGAARLLAGRRYPGRAVRPSVIDLLAVMFTLQLAVFAAQETLESVQRGTPLAPATLIWGVAGQLPVALLAAFAFSLVAARFEAAVTALAGLAPAPWPGPARLAPMAWAPAAIGLTCAQASVSGLGSRAPPSS
jgi:hypothetical protein